MDFSFGKKSPSASGSGPSLWKSEGNFRTSLTEGSSRLFGSVLATKNGLIDGISSKLDQVVNIVGGGEEESDGEQGGESQEQVRPKQRPDQPKQRPDQPKQRPDQPKQRPDQPKQRPDQPKQRPDQPKQRPADVQPQNRSEPASPKLDQRAPQSPASRRPPNRPPAPRQGSTTSNGSTKQMPPRQNSAPVGFENQYTDSSDAGSEQSPSKYPPRPRPMKRRNTNPFLNEDGSLIDDDNYSSPSPVDIFNATGGAAGSSYLDVGQRDLLAITPTSGEALPPPQIEPQPVLHDNHVVYDADSDADSEATEGCDEDREVEEVDEAESIMRSGSMGSDKSWSSNAEVLDDRSRQCMEFMRDFVARLFEPGCTITPLDKAQFGHQCQHPAGRVWFARFVNVQRGNSQRVSEQTFYGLVQHFAVALFECYEEEDFGPAKNLMNMCFTFYFESKQNKATQKHFLYSHLKEQPIWQSLRFWNAAFFDAVQQERARIPTHPSEHANGQDEREFQENVTFGQLGTFTNNMRAFGLSRELCIEFLRKQSSIVNLKEDQVQMLRKNIMR